MTFNIKDFPAKEDAGLDAVLAALNKAHKNCIRVGTSGPTELHPAIPTGSLGLDMALGIGGIPQGRMTEIFGPEGSGKTTLALHIATSCQQMGGRVAFLDVEHALDLGYAQSIGLDPTRLVISQPEYGEQALDIAEGLLRSGTIDLIVIDSVAALVPKAELEGGMADSIIGVQARLMSKAGRKFTPIVQTNNVAILWINQLRYKVGVFFGNPETTPGGAALKFYTTARLDVRKVDNIKVGDQIIGAETKVKVAKNKLAPPLRSATFPLIFGKGIDGRRELLELCITQKILTRRGTWFVHAGSPIAQGIDRAIEYLIGHPNLEVELRQQVISPAPQEAAPEAIEKNSPEGNKEAPSKE